MEFSLITINFILLLCFSQGQAINLTITLNQPRATIRGHALKSYLGNDFYAFQDIPYAIPPLGEFRFAEPQPHPGWAGILNTTRNEKACMQLGIGNTEDCLILNVYAPVKNNGTNLPVFVWIHGGAFILGSGSFQMQNPSYFIDYDIVVVTINYRLGAFGFLTTEDGVIPGNLGLKDQVLALKWVQSNIAAFGGDPRRVTIGGQSAGSISASSHIVSLKAAGLFRAAILESGSSLTHGSFITHARNYSFELARLLDRNFNSNNSTELLAVLRKAPAHQILLASQRINKIGNQVGILTNLRWGVVVEGKNQKNAYITEPIHGSFKNGRFHNVPILIGYTSEEMITFLGSTTSVRTNAAEHDKSPANLISDKLNIAGKDLEAAGTRLKRLYTHTNFTQTLASFVEYSSDIGFVNSIIREADLSSNKTDVYLYEFNYNPSNHTDIPNLRGVGHGGELTYMWLPGILDKNDADKLTSRRLLTMWSNFIKFLNPTPTANASLGIPVWQRVRSNDLLYLEIGESLVPRVNPKKYIGVKPIFDQYLQAPFNIY